MKTRVSVLRGDARVKMFKFVNSYETFKRFTAGRNCFANQGSSEVEVKKPSQSFQSYD